MVVTIDIKGDGAIRYSYKRLQPTYGYRTVRVDSLKQLPDEILYRTQLLDAARGDNGRAELPIGMTRPRGDGGVHYKVFVSDKVKL